MFIDEAKIIIRSGAGGKGAASFRREKFVPMGGPDGGNGGRGGNVYIQGDPGTNTLMDYKYNRHFFAENGGDGGGSNRTGKNGKDLYLILPFGTEIFESTANGEMLMAEVLDKEPILLLPGGAGGIGNAAFPTSVDQSPLKTIEPEASVEMSIILRMKLMGDIGIIGLPSAGKSSLFNKLTNGKSKVGDYDFTTINPKIGVFTTSDGSNVTIVDLPGIIELASKGRGLGLRFLAHAERCKVLLHLIDGAGGLALERYYIIRNEIEKYGKSLVGKPEMVIINKVDLISHEDVNKIKKDFRDIGKKIIFISCENNEGIDNLRGLLK